MAQPPGPQEKVELSDPNIPSTGSHSERPKQAIFSLVDGKLVARKSKPIRSLDDYEKEAQAERVEQSLKEALFDFKWQMRKFARLDGATAKVNADSPVPDMSPPKPNLLQRILPPARRAFEEKAARFEKNKAEFLSGGTDMAEEPGVVVSPRWNNIYDADVEMNFAPAELEFPFESGTTVKGVHRLRATFGVSKRDKKTLQRASSDYVASTLTRRAELNYTREGSSEVYEQVEHIYSVRNHEAPMQLAEHRVTRIEANHENGTLTYVVDTVPVVDRA